MAECAGAQRVNNMSMSDVRVRSTRSDVCVCVCVRERESTCVRGALVVPPTDDGTGQGRSQRGARGPGPLIKSCPPRLAWGGIWRILNSKQLIFYKY